MQTVCGPADQSNENTWRADISADRRHVNVLLDLSEEETKKDLQPHEYHCSPGWDEAVCGWRRVAPYAGLFLAEDTGPRPKHKDIEHDASTSGESVRLVKQPNDTKLQPSTRRSTNTMACIKHNGSNQSPQIPEISSGDAICKNMAQIVLEDQTRDPRTSFPHRQVISKCALADSKSQKPRTNFFKTNYTLAPIKNLTFLPPIINMPHQHNLNKYQQSVSNMENCFIIDKLSRIRGTKGDLVYTTELPKDINTETTSKFRTCQHDPHYYSTVSVSVPNRHHVTVSSKPETLHPRYSVSKALRSGTAANKPLQIHPSCS
ncbi:unnamed protein product [Knipowitschia caucasica]